MAFLMIDGERYALSLGDTTLGGGDDDVLRGSPLASLPPFAVVTSGTGDMVIRGLAGSLCGILNGQPLDAEPRALRHGDHLTVAGLVIHVGDLRAAGRTAHVSGVSDDQLRARAALPGSDPTADTGGRLTTVGGGQTHAIPAAGLVIGRDPDCGIVLDSREVSRRHAFIAPGLLGYTITDQSTNGVFVNGERAERSHRLNQGDVIRVGDVVFRFSADAASYEPDASAWTAAPAASSAAPTPPPAPDASRASEASPTTAPMPKRTRTDSSPPPVVLLATLDVLAGNVPPGMRFRLERPVAQLGRGAENDVCLLDDSISGAHATLMLRGETWHLIDHSSRNGTYVDGRRVNECTLPPECELRLGGVTLFFRAIRSVPSSPIGTLGLIGLTDEQVRGGTKR